MTRADFSENQNRKALVEELESAGAVIMPTGVRCPFHDDKHASGSIYQGKDGHWRYKCHLPTCQASGTALDVYDIRGMTGGMTASPGQPKPKTSKKSAAPVSLETLRANLPGEIEAEYPYLTSDGEIWGVVFRLRMPDGKKSFRQARPMDGKWEWGAPPKPWLLYRLEEIQNAREVVVVEGEKAAEALRAIGVVATTSLCGAGKAAHTDWSPLAGKRIFLWPDNDKPGIQHLQQVAEILEKLDPATSVYWIDPEKLNLEPKGDAYDWIQAGGDREEFMNAAKPWCPPAGEMKDPPPQEAKGEPGERINQADALLKILNDIGVELFHDAKEDGFIAIPVADHIENHRINSTALRRFMQFTFFNETGRTLSSEALKRATDTLDARATFEGAQENIFLRYAAKDGQLFIDLCTPDWTAVGIDKNGWHLVPSPPVKFIRNKGILPLPLPGEGSQGDVMMLRRFVNCARDEDFKLICTWILAAMRFGPSISYPLLCLNGEQGSAKSTVQKILRALVDPNATPLRQIPKTEQDLIISANLGWVLSFDNLSNISPAMSDALCKISTEGGFSTRKLYSDDEEQTFNVRRPVLLNGIEALINRADLLDRSIVIELDPIPREKRIAESTLWSDFKQAIPAIFEGLLSALVAGLRRVDSVKTPLERMADFSRWGAAVAPALGWSEQDFLDVFRENQKKAIEANGEGDPVLVAINGILGRDGILYGSASELHREMIEFFDGHAPFDFPKTARGLVGCIMRLRPALRRAGIEHTPPQGRSNKYREHIIKKIPDSTAPTAPPPLSDTQDEQNQSLTLDEYGGGCGGGSESSFQYRPPYRPQENNAEVECNQVLTECEGAEGRWGRSIPAFLGGGGGPKRKPKNEGVF